MPKLGMNVNNEFDLTEAQTLNKAKKRVIEKMKKNVSETSAVQADKNVDNNFARVNKLLEDQINILNNMDSLVNSQGSIVGRPRKQPISYSSLGLAGPSGPLAPLAPLGSLVSPSGPSSVLDKTKKMTLEEVTSILGEEDTKNEIIKDIMILIDEEGDNLNNFETKKLEEEEAKIEQEYNDKIKKIEDDLLEISEELKIIDDKAKKAFDTDIIEDSPEYIKEKKRLEDEINDELKKIFPNKNFVNIRLIDSTDKKIKKEIERLKQEKDFENKLNNFGKEDIKKLSENKKKLLEEKKLLQEAIKKTREVIKDIPDEYRDKLLKIKTDISSKINSIAMTISVLSVEELKKIKAGLKIQMLSLDNIIETINNKLKTIKPEGEVKGEVEPEGEVKGEVEPEGEPYEPDPEGGPVYFDEYREELIGEDKEVYDEYIKKMNKAIKKGNTTELYRLFNEVYTLFEANQKVKDDLYQYALNNEMKIVETYPEFLDDELADDELERPIGSGRYRLRFRGGATGSRFYKENSYIDYLTYFNKLLSNQKTINNLLIKNLPSIKYVSFETFNDYKELTDTYIEKIDSAYNEVHDKNNKFILNKTGMKQIDINLLKSKWTELNNLLDIQDEYYITALNNYNEARQQKSKLKPSLINKQGSGYYIGEYMPSRYL